VDSTRILRADDNSRDTNRVSLRVRANGYEVLSTADALSVTAVFVKGKPDLVIVDLEFLADTARRNESTNVIGGQRPSELVDRSGIRKYLETDLRAGSIAFFQRLVQDE
jgi:CheY-like chemotaxis protein